MIYGIGETIYDIIFVNSQPKQANPGGSIINSAISISRLQHEVELISLCGNDNAGQTCYKFFKSNNIKLNYFDKIDKKTSISIAFLDQYKEANYDFYKDETAKLRYKKINFNNNDIFFFGGFFSIKKDYKNLIDKYLNDAKNSIIFYDPNIRLPHKNQIKDLYPFIIRNIKSANIIRATIDDFKLLWEIEKTEDISDKIFKINPEVILILTDGSKEIKLFLKQNEILRFSPKQIKPLSTVGAGDTFNASVIASIDNYIKKQINVNDFTTLMWEKIIEKAIKHSNQCCLSMLNYIEKTN